MSRLVGVGGTPTPRPGEERRSRTGEALDCQTTNLKKICGNLWNLWIKKAPRSTALDYQTTNLKKNL
ncbi:hypothetical protein J3R75_001942 [Oligosphaera ethanolica]|uniref:Uncharacterized protein n=1 Tax=Oligosphaera ethanolica TaxID=760260 RepID=A0AAE3VG54_9BACT|nr:hypothetical protein [Oligosphaera ethanolica]